MHKIDEKLHNMCNENLKIPKGKRILMQLIIIITNRKWRNKILCKNIKWQKICSRKLQIHITFLEGKDKRKNKKKEANKKYIVC
jgi:methyltransferase-like protein